MGDNESGQKADSGCIRGEDGGELWSFSLPIAWSMDMAIDFLNRSIAKARRKSGRRLHYTGAVKQGATITFRYLEGNYREKGVL